MTGSSNRFEQSGRWTKAWKLHNWLKGAGHTAESVAGWGDDEWLEVAKAAGVKKPSPITRGMTIGLLAPPVHEQQGYPDAG